ncbi:gamma-glutamylcyclotransferase [Pseudodesulfovibrio sp. zrk46]|nr:gamma-glutamylcyclotransferase [Pseudodesulfovibrio sp. zrk46]
MFVYGTLKKGFPNHYFLQDAEFVGLAKTVERYGLYVDEFPSVYQRDSVSSIQGEVYRIDTDTLRRLDMLEGHPRFYQRQEVRVRLQSGEKISAWMYFYPERGHRLVSGGEFCLSTEPGREHPGDG